MAYIVDGDATDTQTKEHVACRLDNITFLIFRHSFLKTAAKVLLFFDIRKKNGNFFHFCSFRVAL